MASTQTAIAHALSGPMGLLAKLGGTWMERQENAQEAMKKTPEELVLWAIGANDNPLRLNIAKLEFERRVAAAQIETAKSTKSSAQRMLWSVLVLLLTGIFTVVVQYLAWMHPHVPN